MTQTQNLAYLFFKSIYNRPLSKREVDFLDNLTAKHNIRVCRKKLYPFLLRLVKNERGREGYLRVFGRLSVIASLLRDAETLSRRKSYSEKDITALRERVKKVIPWLRKRSVVTA
ncbi:MAG: hypothetical protein N3A54_02225 [Patescibacteria group bacterium]|nr:hypothetical protein [Patescibacteria group bacterium]